MKRILLTSGAVVGSALPALADVRGYGGMYEHGGEHMFFGPLAGLLVLAIIVGLLVALIRWLDHKQRPVHDPAHEALAILNQRLAKGEIDPKEYADRKAALNG